MNVTTPSDKVMVGASFERRGFHKARWLRK
jgi:hypothetical protein